MYPLPTRQVHLDFHTSPLVKDVGASFSKAQFQAMLTKGRVSSVTVFAKCHHGMCYYPTDIGIRHPGLSFDLLGSQMEAAHEIGVRAPVYVTAGWSAADAESHLEWQVRDFLWRCVPSWYDAGADPSAPIPQNAWRYLCLNDGSYARHVYSIIREVCGRYERVDGLFVDIALLEGTCYCAECRAGMEAMGLDPNRRADARAYYVGRRRDFMGKVRAILHGRHPEATLFFNSGGADIYMPEFHGGSTHFEIEDLPTSWGGYDKMPLNARYFSRTGKSYLGMTGKFHTSWGEFGGYKSAEALRYEAAAMLSYGAGCSIGDHLHPDGLMDEATYDAIGHAYGYAEALGDYAFGNSPTSKLGICLSGDAESDQGLASMLLETQNDFGVVIGCDFGPYTTVILPDCASLSAEAEEKLKAFLAGGGKALLTGTSLLREGRFALDVGAEWAGPPKTDMDYVEVGDALAEGMVRAPVLCYLPAERVTATDGEVIAHTLEPYFPRTYGAYFGHRNAPYDRAAPRGAAAVRKGGVIYLSHPVCRMYRRYASPQHRAMLINALNLLQGDKVLWASLPTAGRATLSEQPDRRRYCLNLLYGPPVKRGCVELLEDFPTIYGVPVRIRTDKDIRRVWEPIGGAEIPFAQDKEGGTVSLTVPSLKSHALVVLDY